MSHQDVSIVIPVYNASARLPELAKRIAASTPENVEIIFVDDASGDASWETIRTLCAGNEKIAGVKLAHNMGQYAATLIGMRYARKAVTVTMDDDLQHPPECIPALLAALLPDIDIVYAEPKTPVQSRSYRLLVLGAKYLLACASGALYVRHMRSFRALRTAIYPWKNNAVTRGSALDGLVRAVRPRVAVVSVDYMPRTHGYSSYNLVRSCKLALAVWHSLRVPYPHDEAPAPTAEFAGWVA